ncbi:MAG: Hsp70 family protein [Spirochaetales bacterium]|nr:Hsp70 family protein [Spirochaetales bacterium]
MDTYNIGIKIGDGSFYPVIEETSQTKKRFVLTTVRDGQESMQIDFYRSMDKTIENAEYIGSLVIENIEPKPRGTAEIEVILGVSEDKSLNAVAKNLASGDKQSLSVSLTNLSEQEIYDIPEFELDDTSPPKDVAAGEEEYTETVANEGPGDETQPPDQYKKPNPFFRILFVVLGLIILAGIGYVIYFYAIPYFFNMEKPALNPDVITEETSPSPEPSPEPTKIAEDSSTRPEPTEIPEEMEKPTPIPTSPPTPIVKKQTEKKGTTQFTEKGAYYVIKHGDTLWDLSETFYRTPWLYMKIARANRKIIKDPDLIFAGTKIFIPKK